MSLLSKLRQAWRTAELIANGHWRAEDVVVTWYDPTFGKDPRAFRKVDYPLPKDHPLKHVGFSWPEERTPLNMLYTAKCPSCGFWLVPRYDKEGNQIVKSKD